MLVGPKALLSGRLPVSVGSRHAMVRFTKVGALKRMGGSTLYLAWCPGSAHPWSADRRDNHRQADCRIVTAVAWKRPPGWDYFMIAKITTRGACSAVSASRHAVLVDYELQLRGLWPERDQTGKVMVSYHGGNFYEEGKSWYVLLWRGFLWRGKVMVRSAMTGFLWRGKVMVRSTMYVQPCLCDWVINGTSSRVCVTG